MGILVVTLWSPSKLAYTEPPNYPHNSMVDNSLVFNDSVSILTKEFDSLERSVQLKTAIIDSQHIVLKKLKSNDNKNKVDIGREWIIDHYTFPGTLQGMQDSIPISLTYPIGWDSSYNVQRFQHNY